MTQSQFVLTNNITTTLASPATNTATTLTLANPEGLPALTSGQMMPMTITDAATKQIHECVYVTAINGVTLTVLRAQEGTGAYNWSTGDIIMCAPTAGTVAVTTGNPSNLFQVASPPVNDSSANAAPTSWITDAIRNSVILTDTGTTNAYAAANPVPLTALPAASGVVQSVQIANTNTGPSTYAPDGLTPAPIYGLGGQPLQGGELVASGIATLISFVSPLLNAGNLAYVILGCTGAAAQVAPATQSLHAMQLGQATGRLLNIQTFTESGTYTPTPGAINCRARLWGAGASGAGTTSSSTTATGGGGGGYAEGFFPATTQTVTIGIGGASVGANNAASGANGGSSSFGTLLQCGGGAGGAGGSASGGYLNIDGGGSNGGSSSADFIGGPGGSSGPSPGGQPHTASIGSNGVFPGGGGAASSYSALGSGSGANGYLIVEEYA